MKRILAMLVIMAMLCLPVSAQSTFDYVTDFDYALIRNGGVDGTFVYSAYENNGAAYKMGLLTEDGEQSRQSWTAQGWSDLFAPSDWRMTVHSDAGAFCPYAHTHKDSTLCPYLQVSCVTLTYVPSGITLENVYVYNPKQSISTGNTVHMCFGNYGYTSPETVRRADDSALVAVCNADGYWGVMDLQTGDMLTEFAYRDMSAVCGRYVKVSDGTAWGRLDLSGETPTVYRYKKEADFSVTEEIREIADGQWRVFNADNEPISVVYETAKTPTYIPKAKVVTVTAANGAQTLLDLKGDTVATFETTQKLVYLDRAAFAVENYSATGAVIGVALATVNGVPQPIDTVLKGDVNFDDVLDSADVRLIMQKSMQMVSYTKRQTLAADMNGDGAIKTSDARALLVAML